MNAALLLVSRALSKVAVVNHLQPDQANEDYKEPEGQETDQTIEASVGAGGRFGHGLGFQRKHMAAPAGFPESAIRWAKVARPKVTNRKSFDALLRRNHRHGGDLSNHRPVRLVRFQADHLPGRRRIQPHLPGPPINPAWIAQ